MKILQAHLISGEILDVIYEAREYLVIVSPYVNFNYWGQIKSALVNAKNRCVKIEFFVRSEADNFVSWEEVEQIGITPRLIKNLHAKFYFNEKQGVISSMNLLSSSNSNSIEIGCKLENRTELDELERFVKDYLVANEIKEKPTQEDLYLSKEKFNVVLEDYIRNNANTDASVYFQKGQLIIRAFSNQFFLNIDKVKNSFNLVAIISQNEADSFQRFKFHNLVTDAFKLELVPAKEEYYNVIEASFKKRLSTIHLDKLQITEKKSLISAICNFLMEVDKFKKFVYQVNS